MCAINWAVMDWVKKEGSGTKSPEAEKKYYIYAQF